MTQFLVKSPAVGVKVGGKVAIFYAGAIVAGAEAADAERLVQGGHLERLDAPARPDAVEGGESPPAPSTAPPKDGPGSGKARWADYAAAVGVEVPDGAARDVIIEAIEKAGLPVE